MVADEAQRSRSFGAGTGAAWPPRGRWGVDEEGPERLNLEPATAYEVVTRQMVEGLGSDLREIKGRLNTAGPDARFCGCEDLDVVASRR
jgi:hypothetical protein